MNAEAALYIAIRQNRTAAMGRTLGELKILFCQAVVKYIRLLPTAASNSGKGEPRERQSAKEITDHVCVCDCGGGGAWRWSYVRQERDKRAAKEL